MTLRTGASPAMRTRIWGPRLLAVAIAGVGLGLRSLAWAKPPRPRDPLPDAMAPAPPPLPAEPAQSPLAPMTESAEPTAKPSTHVEIPPGSDVKITIEVQSKPRPPGTVAEPSHPAPAEPAIAPPPPVTRLPLPT